MKQFLLPCAVLLCSSAFAQDPTLEDNFDSYELGAYIGEASDVWSTWSGIVGTDEDGVISDDFANSGTQSLKIFGSINGGPMDVLLPIGLDFAHEVSFQIYVPTGSSAYLNIQETMTPGEEWAFDMVFGSNGNATLSIDQVDNSVLPYNMDAWNEVKFLMDPVNDRAEIYINSDYMNNIAFDDEIGGLNFFGYGDGSTAGLYYIDDLVIVECDDVVNTISETNLEFNFGPNPATDFIKIYSNVSEGVIRIIALNGQVVSETPLNDLSSYTNVAFNLHNGIYLVELTTRNKKTMQKLVVNK